MLLPTHPDSAVITAASTGIGSVDARVKRRLIPLVAALALFGWSAADVQESLAASKPGYAKRNGDAQTQAAALLRADAPRAPHVAPRGSNRVDNSPHLSAQAQAASLLKVTSNAPSAPRPDLTVTLAKKDKAAGDAQAQAQSMLQGRRTE
jgi:hypothetical protein